MKPLKERTSRDDISFEYKVMFDGLFHCVCEFLIFGLFCSTSLVLKGLIL